MENWRSCERIKIREALEIEEYIEVSNMEKWPEYEL